MTHLTYPNLNTQDKRVYYRAPDNSQASITKSPVFLYPLSKDHVMIKYRKLKSGMPEIMIIFYLRMFTTASYSF